MFDQHAIKYTIFFFWGEELSLKTRMIWVITRQQDGREDEGSEESDTPENNELLSSQPLVAEPWLTPPAFQIGKGFTFTGLVKLPSSRD